MTISNKPLTNALPTDSQARKDTPLYRGLLAYFPRACAAVAHLSKIGNDKHNPGEELHWSRGKSNDHADCIMRHLLDAHGDPVDPDDGQLHAVKLAWRALAFAELALEAQVQREALDGTLVALAPKLTVRLVCTACDARVDVHARDAELDQYRRWACGTCHRYGVLQPDTAPTAPTAQGGS